MVLRKHELEASLHEEQQLIQTGQLKEDSPLDLSAPFAALCAACRVGSLRGCQEALAAGANVNAHDAFDYTPLILASLCGHHDVVALLLEAGALCERDTFQGERCLYNALTDSIRNLLLAWDYSKAVDPLRPYTGHIFSLLARERPRTADLVVTSAAGRSFRLHKFVLAARSPYFRKKLQQAPETASWKLPATIPPQAFEVAIRYLYLGELPTDIGGSGGGGGAGYTEEQVLEGIDRLSTHLEIRGLWDGILESGNRRLARQRQSDEAERGRAQLETWFRDNVLRHRLVVETEKVEDIKWDRSNGIYADVLLCADYDEGEEDDLESDAGRGADDDDSGRVELAPQVQTVDGHNLTQLPNGILNLSESSKDEDAAEEERPPTSVVFPAHKAILLRSEYFEAMFTSGFAEAAQDAAYLKVIPVDCSPAVLKRVLRFLYTDKADLPLRLAVDVLFAADMLLIERLKNKAAVIISTLGDDDSAATKATRGGGGSPRAADDDRDGQAEEETSLAGPADAIDPFAVLRAAWLLRVPRLETFAARFFAYRLERYVDRPDFVALVAESAARIRTRQATDSIELVDDIRYYLSERFRLRFEGEGLEELLGGEAEDAAGNPDAAQPTSPSETTGADQRERPEPPPATAETGEKEGAVRTLDGTVAGDEFDSDAINYRVLLAKIDALLERLDLDG